MTGPGFRVNATAVTLPPPSVKLLVLRDDVLQIPACQRERLPLVANAAGMLQEIADRDLIAVVHRDVVLEIGDTVSFREDQFAVLYHRYRGARGIRRVPGLENRIDFPSRGSSRCRLAGTRAMATNFDSRLLEPMGVLSLPIYGTISTRVGPAVRFQTSSKSSSDSAMHPLVQSRVL
jgi:hypothetical protein